MTILEQVGTEGSLMSDLLLRKFDNKHIVSSVMFQHLKT